MHVFHDASMLHMPSNFDLECKNMPQAGMEHLYDKCILHVSAKTTIPPQYASIISTDTTCNQGLQRKNLHPKLKNTARCCILCTLTSRIPPTLCSNWPFI